jgi:hypothetical protein
MGLLMSFRKFRDNLIVHGSLSICEVDEIRVGHASDRSSDAWTLFSCLFADDIGGLLVGAEPEEDRMAHLGITRSLREFYVADELWD